MERKKLITYLLGGIIVLLVLVWALLYGLGRSFIHISPPDGKVISNFNPTISVKTLAPFTGLELVKFEIDDQDVIPSVSTDPDGFIYSSSQRLFEGEHVAEVDFLYRCLFPKKIKLKWSFVVDTTAPEVTFNNFDGVVATPVSRINLEGKSEPDIQMDAFFNNEKLPFSGVDANGNFVLAIWRLPEKENELVLKTVDKAGNTWSKKIPVIFDASPPKILSVFPEGNSVVREYAPIIRVNLEENYKISSINVWVDGGKTDYEFDPKTMMLKCEPPPLANGEHEVKVEIVDVAGNKDGRKWSFELDSTRLVLDVSERQLYLYKGGLTAKTYRVAVGSPRYPTPLGDYKITAKRMNPTWYNPNKPWSEDMPPFIPPGSGNPLGPRALNLSASGIRIHGTPQVWSIGRAASHGCIRMRPSDVIDLYPRVSVGVPIAIIK